MKNKLTPIMFFLIIIFFSFCNSQEKHVTMTIKNKSKITYDSLRVYFYSTEDTVIKNFKPNDVIVRKINFKNFPEPKGERLVSGICAFKDDYYYYSQNGIIGFPYSKLESEYNFLIYDDNIVTKENYMPNFKQKKNKLSEFIR